MVRGGPLQRDEAAVGDFVGTLLMVAVVVALGSVVAVMVATSLDDPVPPRASVSLAALAPGDPEVRLLHRNGEAIPLSALVVQLQRDDAAPSEVARDTWTTPDADEWRPGERLTFPLSPAAGGDERIRVRLFRTDANLLVAELSSRAASAEGPAAKASLAPTLTPSYVVADGMTSTLLAVQVSHPEGALAVASLVADLRNVTPEGAGAILFALNDEGRDGDEVGGDGTWSALVGLPEGAPLGTHTYTLDLTDAEGRRLTSEASMKVKPAAADGIPVSIGVTFDVPTSENVTSLRVRNWTWDKLNPTRMDDDYALFRIVGDNGKSWSCLLTLEEFGGQPYARQMRLSNDVGETLYTPRNGTRLALAGLDMDLLAPVASLQWSRTSGAAAGVPLYDASGVLGTPRFVVAHFGQDVSGSTAFAQNTGFLSAEVVAQ